MIYGGCRVEVGGGRVRGDGSVGAWAAKFVREYGVVPRGVHGSHDLTGYDERRCREFGGRGVPDDLEAVAREHPVRSVANVTQLGGVPGGGPQRLPGGGVQQPGVRDAARRRRVLPAAGGVDALHDRGRRARRKRPGGFLLNSWGPDAHTGPARAGRPVAGRVLVRRGRPRPDAGRRATRGRSAASSGSRPASSTGTRCGPAPSGRHCRSRACYGRDARRWSWLEHQRRTPAVLPTILERNLSCDFPSSSCPVFAATHALAGEPADAAREGPGGPRPGVRRPGPTDLRRAIRQGRQGVEVARRLGRAAGPSRCRLCVRRVRHLPGHYRVQAVVVGVPAGGTLRRIDLPGRPSDAAVRAALRGPPAAATPLPAPK